MQRGDLLFASGELSALLAHQREKLAQEVSDADEEYLLNADIEEWSGYLADRYAVDVPVLHPDDMSGDDEGQVDVDVSHGYVNRAIIDPSQPAYVKGRRLRLRIPFSGDPDLFSFRGSTFSLNPPRAMVTRGELQVVFEYPTDTKRPDIKKQADELVRAVEGNLRHLRDDAKAHNEKLEGEARRTIEHRRERTLADHQHLDNLGIPIRKRGDAPSTYQAPSVKRRAVPRPSAGATPKPTPPEPTIVHELFDHTLGVIRSWSRAMERTPGDYATAGEEKLRDALLIMLNTHYEGQGQGEAYNKGGKTDILIRVEDRNIFIAECKLWKGPKSLDEALEQLFNYATWRDTKLALIFFVRQKAIGPIIEKAKEAIAAQETFGNWADAEEGELRCTMGWPGDPDRSADLAVFFVHLPTA
jgi:hypothetical protein